MKTRILIVDNSKAVRESISYVLEHNGYEVLNANDVFEAFDKIKESGINCIITDVDMPNLEAQGLIKKLRSIPEYRNIPIIMLATESDATDNSDMKESGADDLIIKPFSSDKLLNVVMKVCA